MCPHGGGGRAPCVPAGPQDGDEVGPRDRQGGAALLLRGRLGGHREDGGEPQAGEGDAEPHPGEGRGPEHQLHHGGPAARPHLALRAPGPAPVRGRRHP